MKFVSKQVLMAVAMVMIAAPVLAAEQSDAPRMPTKGTKSYQMAREAGKDANAPAQQVETKTATDVQDIAPAAGATEEKADTGRSLREEMRLPRKN